MPVELHSEVPEELLKEARSWGTENQVGKIERQPISYTADTVEPSRPIIQERKKRPDDLFMQQAEAIHESKKGRREASEYIWGQIYILQEALKQGQDIKERAQELLDYFQDHKEVSAEYPFQTISTEIDIAKLFVKAGLDYQQFLPRIADYATALDMEHQSYSTTARGWCELADFYLSCHMMPEAQRSYRKAFDTLSNLPADSSRTNEAIGWQRFAETAAAFRSALEQDEAHITTADMVRPAIQKAESLFRQNGDRDDTLYRSAGLRVLAAEQQVGMQAINIDQWEREAKRHDKNGFISARLALAEAIRLGQKTPTFERLITLAEAGQKADRGYHTQTIALAYAHVGDFQRAYATIQLIPDNYSWREVTLAKAATLYSQSEVVKAQEELSPDFEALDQARIEEAMNNMALLTDREIREALAQPEHQSLTQRLKRILGLKEANL